MEALIYGCNRLAALLAPHLAQLGYHVAVLAHDSNCLGTLVDEPQINGIAIAEPQMQDYLQQGGIAVADVVLAISDDDHQNALVAQTARHIYNVPTVVCHLANPQLQQLYSGLGLKVVGPSVLDLFETIRQAVEK